MKYYITSDIHSFYTEFRKALDEKGYFTDKEPHKIIICGDLFDRGTESAELAAFVLELMERDEVILIRGNHEDLLLDLLNGWNRHSFFEMHHSTNGTIDTVCQLTGMTTADVTRNCDEVGKRLLNSDVVQKIIPSMLDYYETENYIFVHGWIPCYCSWVSHFERVYSPVDNWRNADERLWDSARWTNGMEAAHGGIIEAGKTIVCGHWHCSFGHSHYERKCSEFDEDADFTPYYSDGIIAIDGCTTNSGIVNCIVIEDNAL